MGKLLNRETLSYIFVGTMTTILSFTLFGAALWIFNEKGWFIGGSPGLTQMVEGHPWLGYIPNLANSLGAFAAELIAAVFALIFSFIANKQFVFKSKSWKAGIVTRELTSFVGSRVLSIFIEMTTVIFLVSILSVNTLLAKIVATVLIVVLNYVISKVFIFKERM